MSGLDGGRRAGRAGGGLGEQVPGRAQAARAPNRGAEGGVPAAPGTAGHPDGRPSRAAQRGQPLDPGAGLVLSRARCVRDHWVRALFRGPARGLHRPGEPDRGDRGAGHLGTPTGLVPRSPLREQQRQHRAGRDGAAAGDRRARAQRRRPAMRRGGPPDVTAAARPGPIGMGIDGFEYKDVTVGGTSYRPGVSGEGRPVLLLHGFPETHYCWHRVAPALTEANTVVVCDLKGYGETRAEPGGPLGEGYSNRERAAELVELMGQLGFECFSVVGHDRGGRVAYRMALDHPEEVERLVVLNIIPTLEQFERMAERAALEYWPWFFLAQPAPFAERVIAASTEYVLTDILESWPAR